MIIIILIQWNLSVVQYGEIKLVLLGEGGSEIYGGGNVIFYVFRGVEDGGEVVVGGGCCGWLSGGGEVV